MHMRVFFGTSVRICTLVLGEYVGHHMRTIWTIAEIAHKRGPGAVCCVYYLYHVGVGTCRNGPMCSKISLKPTP